MHRFAHRGLTDAGVHPCDIAPGVWNDPPLPFRRSIGRQTGRDDQLIDTASRKARRECRSQVPAGALTQTGVSDRVSERGLINWDGSRFEGRSQANASRRKLSYDRIQLEEKRLEKKSLAARCGVD
jgi:hypothetical protein